MLGNIEIYTKEGEFLFFANEKKLNWYKSRNLLEPFNNSYKLTFTPKRLNLYKTDDPYLFQKIDNICVICGSKDNLQNHHVFPKCFTRHFNEKERQAFRKFATHEILLTCKKCHDYYEEKALILKKQIIETYGNLSKSNTIDYKVSRLFGSYKNQNEHGKMTLEKKIREKLNDFQTPLDKIRENYYDVKFAHDDGKPFKKYLDKLREKGDLMNYIIFWRYHFILTMKPEFLPNLWKADKEII